MNENNFFDNNDETQDSAEIHASGNKLTWNNVVVNDDPRPSTSQPQKQTIPKHKKTKNPMKRVKSIDESSGYYTDSPVIRIKTKKCAEYFPSPPITERKGENVVNLRKSPFNKRKNNKVSPLASEERVMAKRDVSGPEGQSSSHPETVNVHQQHDMEVSLYIASKMSSIHYLSVFC